MYWLLFLIINNKALYPGNKYYFEIKIIKGSLIKIGIAKDITIFD